MTAGNKFAFLTGQGGIIHHELHGNGRLTDLLEGNGRNIVRGAECVTDMNIRNTGNGNDGTDAGFLHLNFI